MIWRTWTIEYLCEDFNSTKPPCVQSYLAREVPICLHEFSKDGCFPSSDICSTLRD